MKQLSLLILYKRCGVCDELLPATSDHFGARPEARDGLEYRCYKCLAEKYRKYRIEYAQKIRESRINMARKDIPKALWMGIKVRAKKFGIPFDIDPSDIVIPDTCPVLGIPLFRVGDRMCRNSPSVDRIIPALGYVKGNIEVISMRANVLKRDATPQELQLLAAHYANLTPYGAPNDNEQEADTANLRFAG